MACTRKDLPSLAGKRAIVTGGNSGIGLATATALAEAGAAVTLACRNLDAAEVAAAGIRGRMPAAQVDVRQLDLASLASVRKFAEQWDTGLELLVNNAGVMAPRRWVGSEDGYELQFAVNHLGHFALTGRLLPALLSGDGARVVTVSSLAHRSGDAGVLFGNPAVNYIPMKAYSDSKLANLLFGMQLQRRAAQFVGGRLTSAFAHPGLSDTALFTDVQGLGRNAIVRGVAQAVSRTFLQSARAGAVPVLYAATLAAPGSYSGPRYFGEVRGPAVPARVAAPGQDAELAAQLWDLSEEYTEVTYRWE